MEAEQEEEAGDGLGMARHPFSCRLRLSVTPNAEYGIVDYLTLQPQIPAAAVLPGSKRTLLLRHP